MEQRNDGSETANGGEKRPLRGSWTMEQKRQIVAESNVAGADLAEVARRHGVLLRGSDDGHSASIAGRSTGRPGRFRATYPAASPSYAYLADGRAYQAERRKSHLRRHAPHLAVLSFTYRELDPRRRNFRAIADRRISRPQFLRLLDEIRVRRPRREVAETHAFAQLIERRQRWRSLPPAPSTPSPYRASAPRCAPARRRRR